MTCLIVMGWLVLAQIVFGFLWWLSCKRIQQPITIKQAFLKGLFKFWLALDQFAQVLLAPTVNIIFNPSYPWGQSVDQTISYCLAKNMEHWPQQPFGWFWVYIIKGIEFIDPGHMDRSISKEEADHAD